MFGLVKRTSEKQEFYCSNRFCENSKIDNYSFIYDEDSGKIFHDFTCSEIERVATCFQNDGPLIFCLDEPKTREISRKEALKLLEMGKLK